MLGRLLTEYQGEVAAVMMEPARSEWPEQGYLEGVKELARRHGALLIFDEVSCGWRESLGGMQKYLGVTPDITVIAKGMSNGYPMGAVVGSCEAMEPAKAMFIPVRIGAIISVLLHHLRPSENSKGEIARHTYPKWAKK